MSLKLRLSSMTVFQYLGLEHAAILSGLTHVVTKDGGDAIVLQDEPCAGLFVIVEGQVGVYAKNAPTALTALGVGDSFGEISFLQESLATATVRAQTSTTLLFIRAQELNAAIDADPVFGRAVYRGLALNLSAKLVSASGRVLTDLDAGRTLLRGLGEPGSPGDLPALPETVQRYAGQIDAAFEAVERSVAGLDSDAPAFPVDLGRTVRAARGGAKEFFPRLARQLEVVASFVTKIESRVVHYRVPGKD